VTTLPQELAECEAVSVEILDLKLAKAVWSVARCLLDDGTASAKILVKCIDRVHIDVDVPLDTVASARREVAATNLKVDPSARAFHDGVDAAWLVRRGLEYAAGLEREAEDITVVLGCLPNIADPKDG
jgi:hypothetical protein